MITVVFILTIPLAGFITNILVSERQAKLGAYCSVLFLLLSTLGAAGILFSIEAQMMISQMDWFSVGNQSFQVGLLVDLQGAMMLAVVSLISFLVHLYSIVYMAEDRGYRRYFAVLSLFTFAMNGIILSNNLLMIFLFWELVGLSSYLLIGHWYTKTLASKAAKKAFIVNRIGDAGFIVALCIVWFQFGSFNLIDIQAQMEASQIQDGYWSSELNILPKIWLSVLGIGLFLAAVGKSAQFPLQVWLPDAMEGPTPVSALIHAATMVAAGVFLMSRVFVLLDGLTLFIIATIGATTAFMGGVAALTQFDIKKVLAYSTISQLGYMLMGIGVGSYEAALFHLFTHAFFKAALFLAAGSVIHSLHEMAHKNHLELDAQDMRIMGGLKSKFPVTFYAYLIGSFALMGLPLFSGFLSKDALLVASVNWSYQMGEMAYLVPLLAFLTVLLTSFYMVRQLLFVFFGKPRLENTDVHEGGWHFKLPLIILSILSLGMIWSLNPFDYSTSWFLTALPDKFNLTPGFDTIIADVTNHTVIGLSSVILVSVGAGLAWLKFRPGKKLIFSEASKFTFLEKVSFHNWYLDVLYEKTVLRFIRVSTSSLEVLEHRIIDRVVNLLGWVGVIFSFLLRWFDRAIVDGLINFSAFFSGQVGGMTKSFQYGKVQSFVIFALISLLLIIFLIL
ncbi:MAG: NADH-quinone oxidoreductase subunit L [Bacteroidota bacterium]